MLQPENSTRLNDVQLSRVLDGIPPESWQVTSGFFDDGSRMTFSLRPAALPPRFDEFTLIITRDITGDIIQLFLSLKPEGIVGTPHEDQYLESEKGCYEGPVVRDYFERIMASVRDQRKAV